MSDINKRLQELKTIRAYEYTKEDIKLLKDEWIINWVGNNCLPTWLRWIMTKLFFYLDFKHHDISYWKLEWLPYKEREIWRKRADFWLLKYSWIQPIKYIEKYSLDKWFFINIMMFLYTSIMFVLSLVPCIFVAVPVYIVVRFAWKKSFDSITKKAC